MKKTKLVNFKAKPRDHERWQRACEKAGVTLSEEIRKALNRFAARVEARKDDKE